MDALWPLLLLACVSSAAAMTVGWERARRIGSGMSVAEVVILMVVEGFLQIITTIVVAVAIAGAGMR